MSLEFARLPADFLADSHRNAALAVRVTPAEARRVPSLVTRAVRGGYASWSEVDAAMSAPWATSSLAALGRKIGTRVRRRVRWLPVDAAGGLQALSRDLIMPGFRACVRDVVIAGYGCGYVSGASLKRMADAEAVSDNVEAFDSAFRHCFQKRREYWKDRVAACVGKVLGKPFSPGALRIEVDALCNAGEVDRESSNEQFAVYFADALGYEHNAALSGFDMPSLLRLNRVLAEFNDGQGYDGLYIAPPLDAAVSPFGYGGMIEEDLVGYLGEVDLEPADGAVVLPRGMIEHLQEEYGIEIEGNEEEHARIVRGLRFLRDRGAAKPATDASLHPSIRAFINVLPALVSLRGTVRSDVDVSGDENGGPAALALAGDLSGFEGGLLDDLYSDMMNNGSRYASFYGAKNAARALDLALVDAWVITSVMTLFAELRP